MGLLFTTVLLSFAIWRGARRAQHRAESQGQLIKNVVISAYDAWQQFPVVAISNLDFTSYENSIAVDYLGESPKSAHIPELRETVFNLIKSYSFDSPGPFLAFWRGCDWTIDTNASPYFKQVLGDLSTNSETNIIRAWKRAKQNNLITGLSLTAIHGQVQWTSDISKLATTEYLKDISTLSQVDLPAIVAVGLSRSVFCVEPLPSKIIATDGKVLYGRVVLFVKYRSSEKPRGGSTVPLVLGLYWSDALGRWIPHSKGIISPTDSVGLIF